MHGQVCLAVAASDDQMPTLSSLERTTGLAKLAFEFVAGHVKNYTETYYKSHIAQEQDMLI